MDLYTFLTTDVLNTFAETPGIEIHHMNVVIVVASVVCTVAVAPGPGFGLCVALF